MQHQSRLVVRPQVGCSELHMSYGFEPIPPHTEIFKNVKIKKFVNLTVIFQIFFKNVTFEQFNETGKQNNLTLYKLTKLALVA